MSEIAAVLGVTSLFDPDEIDCYSWLPVEVAETGVELDFCAICSRREHEHEEEGISQ